MQSHMLTPCATIAVCNSACRSVRGGPYWNEELDATVATIGLRFVKYQERFWPKITIELVISMVEVSRVSRFFANRSSTLAPHLIGGSDVAKSNRDMHERSCRNGVLVSGGEHGRRRRNREPP